MKRVILIMFSAIIACASFSQQYYQSVGYGNIFSFDGDSVTMYDYTSVSLLTLMSGKKNSDTISVSSILGSSEYNIAKMDNDSLIVRMEGKNYYYTAIPGLPNVPYNDTTSDPESCFEILWNTVNENCVLFDVAHVDWNEIYSEYRPLVMEETSDSALFEIFTEMLTNLNDGHTILVDFNTMNFTLCGPEKGMEWRNNPDEIQSVVEGYFLNNSKVISHSKNIYSSFLNESTAYIAVNGFAGYGGIDTTEYSGFVEELNEAIEHIQDKSNIIVDLRFNGGGLDLLSFELASRFNKSRKTGYYRQVKVNAQDNLSPEEPFYLEVGTPSLADKKVVVLVSEGTLSAADVCAMLFKNLDGITLLGQNSYGIFSDMLAKVLPNGFVFTISNEKYTDENHQYYEQIGISPDVRVDPDWDLFASGTDNMLEKALEILNPISDIEFQPKERNEISVIQEGRQLIIKYSLKVEGDYWMNIYDCQGRLQMKERVALNSETGEQSVPLTIQESGVYLIQVAGNNFKTCSKMVILK